MSEREQRIRIAVVDDHEMFRAGVIATLQPHFDVVGQAADVEGSVAMIAQTKPDVVLLDVHVPGGEGGGGTEILTKSRALLPRYRVSCAVRVRFAAGRRFGDSRRRAGIRDQDDFRRRSDVRRSSRRMRDTPCSRRNSPVSCCPPSKMDRSANGAFGGPIHDDELDRLSNREQEVMRLIARGYTYKEVASELFISIKTVETHMSSVLRKLQLSNRSELTRWAADRRIV